MTTVHSRRRGPLGPRSARILAGVGTTVAVCGLVAACGASAEDDKTPDRRAFSLPGRTLTLDSDDSALDVVVSDHVKDVRVTRWFDGRTVLGNSPKVTWKQSAEGDKLTFRVKCSGVISNCSAKHRVVVPRGVAVTILNRDGQVTASGFREPLKVRTADGSVTVRNSSGPLDLSSADGSVRTDGVTSKRVSARSRDGSVWLELGAVPDRVRARSTDGSVTVGLPDARYRVDTESVDGGVDVSVPRADDSPHRVSVRSVDGHITVRAAN
ncbi:DUF4097 family beta strand repeat-containing protein [Streptomyces sp. NPDC053474]|uniref:DUF4097 family beta strand repeat-containing protein n=1 Tax=Streptomyces sp. NPDC053474 TaxID=3365704 RepID=UPI0037D27A14